jgi:hypothetical protein
MTFNKKLHDILPLLGGAFTVTELAQSECLPPVLAVDNISLLWAPDSQSKQEAFSIMLKSVIRNNELDTVSKEEFTQAHDDWEKSRNPEIFTEPKPPDCLPALACDAVADRDQDIMNGQDAMDRSEKMMFVVHRDEMREWLIKENEWPLPSENLLSRWWPESERRYHAQSEKKGTKTTENIFRKEGDKWVLHCNDETRYLNDSKGFLYIAYLLERPGKTHTAPDLIKAIKGPGAKTLSYSFFDKVADEDAIQACKKRIHEINTERVENSDDPLVIEELNKEFKKINRYLSQTIGLGDKRKKFSNEITKQIHTVSTAINRSLDKIKKTHPALWRHLDNSIKTGSSLSYNPETDISWITIQ